MNDIKTAGTDTRPSWDEYFMQMAELTAQRSTCLRRKVGAVIVKDKHIIATGYNGAPRGLRHCGDLGGCLRQKLGIPSGTKHEICYAIHAEQNAIIQAAKLGISIDGATLYCTHYPCTICAKMIVNSGIKRVVFLHPYPDDFSGTILSEGGVLVEQYPGQEE